MASSSSSSSFNLSTRKNDASINASSLSSSSSSRSCFDQTTSRIVSFDGQQSLLAATATATATTSSQNHVWSVVEGQPPSPVPESSTIQYDMILPILPHQTVSSASPKPPKFTPGPFDVICARGKQAYNHDGNKHFRGLVSAATEKYSKVESKLQRSMIVTDIVTTIRDRGNGFLRMDDTTGEWIACSDVLCREKVGQYFRLALGRRYKSKSRSIKKSKKINRLHIMVPSLSTSSIAANSEVSDEIDAGIVEVFGVNDNTVATTDCDANGWPIEKKKKNNNKGSNSNNKNDEEDEWAPLLLSSTASSVPLNHRPVQHDVTPTTSTSTNYDTGVTSYCTDGPTSSTSSACKYLLTSTIPMTLNNLVLPDDDVQDDDDDDDDDATTESNDSDNSVIDYSSNTVFNRTFFETDQDYEDDRDDDDDNTYAIPQWIR